LPRAQLGISLVECLVTLAVTAVLANAAYPAWQSLHRHQAMKAAAAQWMACLVRARSEALQTGTELTVLPMPAGWSAGWVLTRDANGNGVLDPGEEKLHVYGPAPPAMKTEINFGKQGVQFQASGRPVQAGHIMLELEGVRRKLVVNMLGRPRLCDPDSARAC
jgi:type IV fimbrial biogenesis protein FimT